MHSVPFAEGAPSRRAPSLPRLAALVCAGLFAGACRRADALVGTWARTDTVQTPDGRREEQRVEQTFRGDYVWLHEFRTPQPADPATGRGAGCTLVMRQRGAWRVARGTLTTTATSLWFETTGCPDPAHNRLPGAPTAFPGRSSENGFMVTGNRLYLHASSGDGGDAVYTRVR